MDVDTFVGRISSPSPNYLPLNQTNPITHVAISPLTALRWWVYGGCGYLPHILQSPPETPCDPRQLCAPLRPKAAEMLRKMPKDPLVSSSVVLFCAFLAWHCDDGCIRVRHTWRSPGPFLPLLAPLTLSGRVEGVEGEKGEGKMHPVFGPLAPRVWGIG